MVEAVESVQASQDSGGVSLVKASSYSSEGRVFKLPWLIHRAKPLTFYSVVLKFLRSISQMNKCTGLCKILQYFTEYMI